MIDFKKIEHLLGKEIPKEIKLLNNLNLSKWINTEDNNFISYNNFLYNKKVVGVDELVAVDHFIQKKHLIKYYWLPRIKSVLWIKDKEYLGLGVLSNPSNAILVFSLNEWDKGSIWLETHKEEINRVKIADSLIEFLNHCEEKLSESILAKYQPIGAKLYKNWGEDFWRIREDKIDS